MRYLKVGYIDPDTKVPGLKKAMERLTILNMSYEERKIYEDYRFERHYDENMLKAARYVGREEAMYEIAYNLKTLGMDDASIAKATGLSPEEVNSASHIF